mmetsp:Transcript_58688/g.132280  ORF Transcript_58688/g.132280 Transcript_58688/m.132280 type:complete len:460 (-) Transcript_58688:236-1615(-)
MAPGGSLLRPGEEEWQPVFERLCERFPNFTPEKIAGILRENQGAGGQAAATLRDLLGTAMRPVDPDDAEHVRTLLSSPVMFSHACKEQFRKHDVNGDGVLEWTEVLELTNSLYENFGLEAPREGGLRAFFEANDTNKDGVLSEKEFKRFFECFLRYAFFDVVKHEQEQKAAQQAQAEETPTSPVHQVASPAKAQAASPPPENAGSRRRKTQDEAKKESGYPAAAPIEAEEGHHRSHRSSRRSAEGRGSPSPPAHTPVAAGTAFRCIAPHGVTYRRTPEYNDRADSMVKRGSQVHVLETWVRTNRGWLPLADGNGQVLFEVAGEKQGRADVGDSDAGQEVRFHKSVSGTPVNRRSSKSSQEDYEGSPKRSSKMEVESVPSNHRRSASTSKNEEPEASAGGHPGHAGNAFTLRPDEEEWRTRWVRLQERFPTAGPEAVLQALRDYNGHAGQAASALRALCG